MVIEIGIASETKAFKQGIESGVIKPVEDATNKLDAMGRSRGPGQLEDGLRDAQRASERLQKEVKETANSIEDKFRASYREMARSADTGFDRSREAVRGFKDEARQNFAEVASSFDGTAQGIADGIQGTLGGAAIAVGGVAGLAIGALGAVGGAVVQQVTADAEAAEERVQEMYDAFIESGVQYLTQQQALDALSAITGDPERVKELQKQADDLGLSIQTILLAQIQRGDERNAVQERNNELLEAANKKLEDGTITTADNLVALEAIRDEYLRLNGEQDKAVQGADLYRTAQQLITGEAKLTNEEIQKRNKLLAETPATVSTKLLVDDSDLTNKLSQSRTIRLNIEGYARNGQRVV